MHSRQDGTAVERDWSSCIQRYQRTESWSLEAKEWKNFHSLQRRFNEHRTLVPNSSLCKAAQCLRSRSELVLSIWFYRKGRIITTVDNKILTKLTPEVQLFVSPPKRATGNRMPERVQSFEELTGEIHLTPYKNSTNLIRKPKLWQLFLKVPFATILDGYGSISRTSNEHLTLLYPEMQSVLWTKLEETTQESFAQDPSLRTFWQPDHRQLPTAPLTSASHSTYHFSTGFLRHAHASSQIGAHLLTVLWLPRTAWLKSGMSEKLSNVIIACQSSVCSSLLVNNSWSQRRAQVQWRIAHRTSRISEKWAMWRKKNNFE